MNNNITKHDFKITKTKRNLDNHHNSFLIWFTGLSGSGKSSIANNLEFELNKKGIKTYILDGDNLRHGLNSDLCFSDEDRKENIRRVSEVSKLFIDAGIVVLACFISPVVNDRKLVKKIVGDNNFIEIYINTPLHICEKRDVKGLYKMARKGLINNFTGIDSNYEEPSSPDIEIKTNDLTIKQASKKIMTSIKGKLNYE